MELISVVISVFNIEDYLPKCLESVAAQTFSNLEILLIDDGSTDKSGTICDEFAANDSRVRVIHQENRGLWAVRNRGQAEAQGEYLVFPDGDDYFHKDYIRILYEAINYGGKQYPFAICNYRRTSGDNEDTTMDMKSDFSEISQSEILDMLTFYATNGDAFWGAHWNKIYRKASLPVPFQKNYARCQDFDSNLRLSFCVSSCIITKSALYYWRERAGQLTRTDDYKLIRYKCRSRIFYNVLQEIPSHLSNYKQNILITLYTILCDWREFVYGSTHEEEAIKQIKQIEKSTIFKYLFCGYGSFLHKLHILFLLNFSKTAHAVRRHLIIK